MISFKQRRFFLSLGLLGPLMMALSGDACAEGGKHLFILSGQSNMAGHRPEEAFIPAVESAFGADNVLVVQDAQGGQPIQRWWKGWKSPAGEAPETAGDLYDRLMAKVRTKIPGQSRMPLS